MLDMIDRPEDYNGSHVEDGDRVLKRRKTESLAGNEEVCDQNQSEKHESLEGRGRSTKKEALGQPMRLLSFNPPILTLFLLLCVCVCVRERVKSRSYAPSRAMLLKSLTHCTTAADATLYC